MFDLIWSMPMQLVNHGSTRAHQEMRYPNVRWRITENAAQMFDGLHLKRHAHPVKDHQGHSVSLPLLLFDRPYTISYSSIVSISLFCTVFEIFILICQKIKTSRDLDHADLGDRLSSQDWYFSGQPVHKIWRFYLQLIQRNLRGCKILQWITWPGHAPFKDDQPSEF